MFYLSFYTAQVCNQGTKKQQKTQSSSPPPPPPPPQSFEEATVPLADDQQIHVDEDSEFSLHFHLAEVKSSLSEVKDKMDDIRMGEVRSRGFGGSCELSW